jgi:murein DD-endopeptidase MepM/ murein hydrolase activator NlpD
MLLSGGLVALGNVPVYSSVQAVTHSDDSAKNVSKQHLTRILELPATPAVSYAGYAQETSSVDLDIGKSRWKYYQLKSKDSAELGFKYIGVAESLYKQLIKNEATKAAFDNAESGANVFAQYQGNEVHKLLLLTEDSRTYLIKKTESGYVGEWDKHAVEKRKQHKAFTIKTSVNYDASKAGVSSQISKQIRRALKHDLNFKRDIRVGDQVAVIYEDLIFEGERLKSTDLLAVEYSGKKGKTFQRIRFALNDGKTYYLTPDGDAELKRKLFNRRPLNARISSHFNPNRRHPIFKTRRSHTGTDYAAPRGTPIKATGDGSVQFVGRKGGYGKTVVLRHGGSIKTLYAHMSRYKKGIKSGQKVKKGDVIGYVGSTGNSTGNHVHYEFIVAGKHKNPETVKLPSAGIMTKKEQRVFRKVASGLIEQIHSTKRLADAEIDVNRENGG